MLESAKDQVIGVDTPGQQVLPCVRYGTACSDEWEIGVVTHQAHMVQEGSWYRCWHS
jgi:hypothetical protein